MSAPDHEYIVLSESDVKHLVCVRRDETPDWLQIIAIFADEDRASQYAEVENDMVHDNEPRDDVREAPTLDAPPDQLRRLVRGTITEPVRIQAKDEPRAAIEAQDEPIELEPEAEAEPEPDGPEEGKAGKIPEFILRFLPGWVEKYPGGPTIKQVVDECKLAEPDVREAFNEIRRREMAVVWQAHQGAPLQVAPLGFEPPPKPDLSDNQSAVLGYLSELEPDDSGTVAPPSLEQMHKQTGVPKGSLGATLSDLERKKKISLVARGTQFAPARYRVVDRTILRQALREDGPRDASHLVFDDPPLERSALAAKRDEPEKPKDPPAYEPRPTGALNGSVTIFADEGEEAIQFRGQVMEVNAKQAAFLQMLATGKGNPISREFLKSKLWPTQKNDSRETSLSAITSSTRLAVKPLGLDVVVVPGVGIALQEVA